MATVANGAVWLTKDLQLNLLYMHFWKRWCRRTTK